MMQITKGAGLVELIGFNVFEHKENYKIYKPLLQITKEELQNYLKQNNLKYFIDNSNFDEKYKRNFFRHNFSDKLLEEFKEGIKKSFDYLQKDLNSLNIQDSPKQKIKELEIFVNQKDDNLNIRTIDLSLKRRGILLTNAQRNEILKQKEITIDKPITNDTGLIKLKMKTDANGKESTTIIKPIFYNKEKNQTLVEAIPLTGRQHQIRVHLDSIGNKIVGDPLYGVNEEFANLFLKNQILEEDRVEITKASRLMLQADYLEFEFLDVTYKFTSKQTLF